MTVQSFIAELAKVREQFEWRLEPDSSEGSERREWTRYQIRAVPEGGDVVLDPIGAVCYARTGKSFDALDLAETCKAIGLAPEDAQHLADAANDKTWEESNGRRRPNVELQALRVEIIRAVETPARSINL
jgi:hypothetical protein